MNRKCLSCSYLDLEKLGHVNAFMTIVSTTKHISKPLFQNYMIICFHVGQTYNNRYYYKFENDV